MQDNQWLFQRLGFTSRATAWVAWAAFSCVAGLVVGRADIPLQLKIGFLVILLPAGLLLLGDAVGAKAPRTSRFVGLFLVALAGFAIVLAFHIDQAWVDHHGFNGAVWSIFGRVIQRHGFAATQGLCFWTGGPVLNLQAAVYDHHPPGLPWLLAVAFGVFGAHEWVARLLPILFTLAALAGFGALVGQRYGSRAAGGMLLVAAASPAVTFSGRMVNFEPIILSLAILFYVSRELIQPGRARDAVLLGILALAPATAWVGIPFAAIGAGMVLWEPAVRSRINRALFWLVPLLSTLFAVLYATQWGATAGTVWNRAWAWNSAVNTGLPVYSALVLIKGILNNIKALTPWPLWLALPLLLIRDIRTGLDWRLMFGVAAPFLLLVPIMPNAVYAHDYHMLFWWPLLALVFAKYVALLADRRALLLATGLFLLYPLQQSFDRLKDRHAVSVYARHQVKTGTRINATVEPEARVAIVNPTGDFAPILAYALDRDYKVFKTLGAAVQDGAWDYYCLLHKSRGVSEAEVDALLKVAVEIPDPNVRLFRAVTVR